VEGGWRLVEQLPEDGWIAESRVLLLATIETESIRRSLAVDMVPEQWLSREP
jgi:hypothetical protein